MKNVWKRAAALLTVLMISSMLIVPASAKDITVYTQTDSRWNNHAYGYQDTAKTKPGTIGTSGGGILALTNAVCYLNDCAINPEFSADYAVNNGYRVNGVGTSHAFFESFLRDYGAEIGAVYGGSIYGFDTLKDYLNAGYVAICWTSSHLMAIGDYDNATSRYLLLDSAPSYNRGTAGTGYCWKTKGELQNMGLYSSFYVIREFGGRCTLTTALDWNMALDVYGNYSDDGTNIQIYPYHGGGAQDFTLVPAGGGWYKIRHNASGKVLNIEGASSASGANVILWYQNDEDNQNGGDNQLWKFIPSSGGYRIQSKLGTYLDVSGASTSAETNVWAYEGNGTNAQLWYINWFA